MLSPADALIRGYAAADAMPRHMLPMPDAMPCRRHVLFSLPLRHCPMPRLFSILWMPLHVYAATYAIESFLRFRIRRFRFS